MHLGSPRPKARDFSVANRPGFLSGFNSILYKDSLFVCLFVYVVSMIYIQSNIISFILSECNKSGLQ